MADQEDIVDTDQGPAAPVVGPASELGVWFDGSIRNTRFSRHTPTANRITAALDEIKRALENCPGQ